MPKRIRVSSTSARRQGRVRIRALVSGGIGDELLALPALRYLADALPDAFLEVRLGEYAERHRLFELLLLRAGAKVLSLEAVEKPTPGASTPSCDWLLDLDSRSVPLPAAHLAGSAGSLSVKTRGAVRLHWRRAFEVAFHLAKRVGGEARTGWAPVTEPYRSVSPALPAPAIRAKLRRWLGTGRRRRVAISPGGNAPPGKRWPLPDFARVAIGLLEVGCDVFVLGGPVDSRLGSALRTMVPVRNSRARGRLLDLTGRTRLEEVPAILSRMDLHLANDNGLLHIGGALDVPQVGLYQETASRYLTPGRRDRRIFCAGGRMDTISPESVAEACGDVLGESRTRDLIE